MKNLLKKLPHFERRSPLSHLLKVGEGQDEPPTLTQYRLVENNDSCSELFDRMKKSVLEINEQTRRLPGASPKMRYEWGHLSEGRKFFFLQPWNDDGLLFEQAQKGWIISKAHKIPQENRFMRESRAWDVVTVFEPETKGTLRLSSSRFGDDLLSFPLYQEALLEALPLGGA